MNFELQTDDKAVEEKNEDTDSLTYWASKILNTACPQQKVSEEQCVIALPVYVQVLCVDLEGGESIQNSNLLNSHSEITENRLWIPPFPANTIIHWTPLEKFSAHGSFL